MVSENEDQRALRLWLHAGLQIPEVVGLRGDAGYLLNNMIAKYTLAADEYAISIAALGQLRAAGVDLSARHKRSRFYGKNRPFVYEHAIPAGVVRAVLLASDRTLTAVGSILERAGEVALLLRTEDQQLGSARLAAKMPPGWTFGDDPLARYRQVGIALSSERLRVGRALKR